MELNFDILFPFPLRNVLSTPLLPLLSSSHPDQFYSLDVRVGGMEGVGMENGASSPTHRYSH